MEKHLAISTGDLWKLKHEKLVRVTAIRLHSDCEPSLMLEYIEPHKHIKERIWRSQFEALEPTLLECGDR